MQIMFFVTTIILLVSAMCTVFSKNMVNTLLWSILSFIMIGILFVVLGATYNSVVQLLVYVVTIPILIAVSIVFTSKSEDISKKKSKLNIFCSVSAVLLFVILMSEYIVSNADIFEIVKACSIYVNPFSDIISISMNLLSKYSVLMIEFALGVVLAIVGISNYEK